MPTLAPTVTQTVAADLWPCPAGTTVATLAPGAGETDLGPFVYAVATGSALFTVVDTALNAAVDLSGPNDVGVTVAGSDLTPSPETVATITVGSEPIAPPITGPSGEDDGYINNPQFPPAIPEGAVNTDAWPQFLVAATHIVVPHARDGVDFVVTRTDKTAALENVHWDDDELGPRPTAEIEDEAKRLAAEWPSDTDVLL